MTKEFLIYYLVTGLLCYALVMVIPTKSSKKLGFTKNAIACLPFFFIGFAYWGIALLAFINMKKKGLL